MPIKLKCSCGQVLSVPDNMAGKSGKCPKCQAALKIPAANPAGGSAPATRAPATAAVAPQPNKMESLFEEAGLTRKTGPVCPKCSADIRPGTVLCVGCGLNFQTGEQATAFNYAAQGPEFKNEYLQEAATNMTRDTLMNTRRDKSGIPWWMIMSYLLGAITLCAAGVIIVDGRFNEPAPAGTFLGNLQRLPVFVVLGMTLIITGQCIHGFAHLSIVIFGFTKHIGMGFACLFVPLFSYIYGIMNWADNKAALMAIVMSMVTIGAGVGLIIAGGGFGTLQGISQ